MRFYNQIYLLHLQLQTFILFTYGEMWLLKKISCEIQILNEKVGKLMIENGKLEEENKRLKGIIENTSIEQNADRKHIEQLEEENKKLKEELEKLRTDNIYEEGLYD